MQVFFTKTVTIYVLSYSMLLMDIERNLAKYGVTERPFECKPLSCNRINSLEARGIEPPDPYYVPIAYTTV